jgi:uncharacterized membrane protein
MLLLLLLMMMMMMMMMTHKFSRRLGSSWTAPRARARRAACAAITSAGRWVASR